MRIRCKRLRYALEFVSEIYDGRTRGVVRRVVGLQDCLGLMQDAQVAATRLRSLATTEHSGLSPATLFAMGTVAERYRRDSDRLMATLPTHLAALNGPGWKKLKKLMERRRREVGPPDTWSPGPSAPTDPPRDGITGSGGPLNPPPPWPHSFPPPSHPGATADDDSEWDDVYTPALRSVPAAAEATADGLPSEGGPQATPPPPVAPPSGGRRKEPVFLPASSPPSGPTRSRPAGPGGAPRGGLGPVASRPSLRPPHLFFLCRLFLCRSQSRDGTYTWLLYGDSGTEERP